MQWRANRLHSRRRDYRDPTRVYLKKSPKSKTATTTTTRKPRTQPHRRKKIAGVHGTITRYVTTINGKTATYHFYELDAQTLDSDWLESRERRREWVDYAEAIRRLQWKPELAQGLSLSSLAPRR